MFPIAILTVKMTPNLWIYNWLTFLLWHCLLKDWEDPKSVELLIVSDYFSFFFFTHWKWGLSNEKLYFFLSRNWVISYYASDVSFSHLNNCLLFSVIFKMVWTHTISESRQTVTTWDMDKLVFSSVKRRWPHEQWIAP